MYVAAMARVLSLCEYLAVLFQRFSIQNTPYDTPYVAKVT